MTSLAELRARAAADGSVVVTLMGSLLPLLMHDPDLQVRLEVAQRVAMPALWRMVEDGAPEVRRVVAERLPASLLLWQ